MSGGLAVLVIVSIRDLITAIAAKSGCGFLDQTFVLHWWDVGRISDGAQRDESEPSLRLLTLTETLIAAFVLT